MSIRKLKGAVVVITGATSGIGRATALAFAHKGASLLLAARDEEGLEEVVSECLREGALAAYPVVTDMTKSAAVRYLAEHAAELGNGRIDVWFNNAGVGAVGGFVETPLEVHEQVVLTNLLGYLYAAHAVLPYFMRQHEGVLINNISFGAWWPTSYAVAYSASKYGLEGFSQALRGELDKWPRVRICDVYPAFVNTPGLSEHAANYTGRDLGYPGLAMEPAKVADVIVRLAQKPRDHTPIGALASTTRVAHAFAPGIMRRLTARMAELFFRLRPRARPAEGDLFAPRHTAHTLGAAPGPRRFARAGITALLLGGVALLIFGTRSGRRMTRQP